MAENRSHLYTIENFIEKYLPIRVLAQMSEIFREMFPKQDSREAGRLQKYEEQTYYKYNQAILDDDGEPDLK